MPVCRACVVTSHFTGKVSVDEDALDLHPGPLNITSPLPKALIIKRTCMIYQKFEQSSQEVKNDTLGAGQTTTTTYTVKEDWTPIGPQAERLPHLTDETNSRGIWDELVAHAGTPESAAPSAGAAPPGLPPELAALLQQVDPSKAPHGIAVSRAAHVGGFGIASDLVMAEPATFQSEWMPLPAELVPDDIEALPELRKDRYGNLTTVEEGDLPMNGDVMIKYEYVADGFDASFVVQQVLAESDPETGVPVHKYGVSDRVPCFGLLRTCTALTPPHSRLTRGGCSTRSAAGKSATTLGSSGWFDVGATTSTR